MLILSFCLISLAKLWLLACQSNSVGGTVNMYLFLRLSSAVRLAVSGFLLFDSFVKPNRQSDRFGNGLVYFLAVR